MNVDVLFCDFDFMGGYFYETVVKISRCITYNTSKADFGFSERSETAFSDNSCLMLAEPLVVGHHFAAVQIAAAFALTFPHILGLI